MVRVKPHRVGDTVKVRSVHGGYPLAEGVEVSVVAFDHAYRLVEWQGKEFRVYMANIDTGGQAKFNEETRKETAIGHSICTWGARGGGANWDLESLTQSVELSGCAH